MSTLASVAQTPPLSQSQPAVDPGPPPSDRSHRPAPSPDPVATLAASDVEASDPTRGTPAGASRGTGSPLRERYTRLLRDERVAKWIRYGTVSVIATSLSMITLAILVSTGATTAGWANVIATCVAIGPSFELNRRWVWGHDGPRSWHKQVLPFAVLTFTGLGLSTLAVHVTNGWALHAGLGTGARTLAVEAANLAAFGSVWLLQFFVLDRILFHRPHT